MLTKNAPRRVLAERRRLLALELRQSGLTYDDIALRLKVSSTRARQLVDEAMRRTRADTAEAVAELRRIEAQRLQTLLAAVWDKALAGDIKAVAAAVRIVVAKARLLGLEAATRVEVRRPLDHPIDRMSDDELIATARDLGIPVTTPRREA